jgi:membrane protease subunit HflC
VENGNEQGRKGTRMSRILGPVVAALVAIAFLASASLFTVDQRQNAIVFQLGEVKDVVTTPGLHFKWPLIQNLRFFDMRILTYDDTEPLRFITSEKKPVLVDSFVKWRIVDVKQFYVSVQGSEVEATRRLRQTISGGLQAEFGNRTVHDVVSGERDRIMAEVRDKADLDLRRVGVEIVDVRLKRVDLPQEVSDSVYRRMEAERKRVANEQRSTGSAEAERIRADADRQREVILAEAYRDAQSVRGEGDAKSAGTYAAAFSQNPEFYSFYRSMEAYRATFRGRNDVMLLEPNSEFFRYLKDASGRGSRESREPRTPDGKKK